MKGCRVREKGGDSYCETAVSDRENVLGNVDVSVWHNSYPRQWNEPSFLPAPSTWYLRTNLPLEASLAEVVLYIACGTGLSKA